MINIRQIALSTALLLSLLLSSASFANIELSVNKDPNCGCCTKWIEHLENNGIQVSSTNNINMGAFKQSLKIPEQAYSCHTGVSGEQYIFEGHVPAKSIKRFFKEKPKGARGLTVPAMPLGSPGMEMGDKLQAYDVYLINEDGSLSVFEHIDSLQP